MAGFIVHKVLKSVVQLANADDEFFEAQQNHPGVESATSALRSGNGMKRCRDRSEIGLDRYVPLAIPGRNRQTLGHLLIAQQAPQSEAAAQGGPGERQISGYRRKPGAGAQWLIKSAATRQRPVVR